MCGIAGYYSLNHKLPDEQLRKMTDSLTHRGPDSEGYCTDETVSLGVKRLRIIDLTSNSDQPAYSTDGRYVIIFNGEVYNFHEILNEIKSNVPPDKFSFHAVSECRILIEAFTLWGPSFVHKLNGMFAIAIYDKMEKSLYLFLDRFGIKPLHYFWNGSRFAFASEIKALLTLPFIENTIDGHAICQYLNSGFIPAPKSIYKSINKILPGTFLKLHNNICSRERYWSPESCFRDDIIKDETHALVQLSELLKSSVLYQLNSDVTTGIFLSGGIDSSLITAKARNLSSVKVNTYSIGFEDEEFSELIHARSISRHLGTNHHEFIVSQKNALPLVDEILDLFDEPFADVSAIPMQLLAKFARLSATVVLSGEGADELFFGYGAYRWAKRLDNPFLRLARKPIRAILSKMDTRYKRAAKLFEFENNDGLHNHIFSQEQYFFSLKELDENILTGNIKPFLSQNEIENNFPDGVQCKKRKLIPQELQALFDLKQYLPNDLLVQADRTSMSCSVEMRVPFLDHRLVEFAINLSPSLKIKGRDSKYLLRKLLERHVPRHLTDRPKQGFAIPLSKWLSKEWKILIDETLTESNIASCGIVEGDSVKKLILDFRNGDKFLFNRIWQLIVLHKWMLKHKYPIE
ncbi:MAG: asparagine synthase (glutamine-hydrolyzing) [Bacteroidetes bacterium]|nr:asparagine synthase (glutamine-hydrolyzing) [Bacteroidota bacterium]